MKKFTKFVSAVAAVSLVAAPMAVSADEKTFLLGGSGDTNICRDSLPCTATRRNNLLKFNNRKSGTGFAVVYRSFFTTIMEGIL